MPFTPIPNLPNTPLVRIFFSGQLVLTPASAASAALRNCEVFVNNRATDHNFTVEVRQKRPNHPDVLVMRQIIPLLPVSVPLSQGAPVGPGMLIGVDPGGGGAPRGVNAYNGAITSPEGAKLDDAMSMAEVHRTAGSPRVDLTIDTNVGRPSILLNDATLYAAEPSVGQFTLTHRGGAPLPTSVNLRQSFASLVGANIYPAANQVVIMRWNRNNVLTTLAFVPPGASESFTYEVYVSNDPLFDPNVLQADPPLTHGELEEYYKLYSRVDPGERLTLGRARNPSRGSPRIPCMPLIDG